MPDARAWCQRKNCGDFPHAESKCTPTHTHTHTALPPLPFFCYWGSSGVSQNDAPVISCWGIPSYPLRKSPQTGTPQRLTIQWIPVQHECCVCRSLTSMICHTTDDRDWQWRAPQEVRSVSLPMSRRVKEMRETITFKSSPPLLHDALHFLIRKKLPFTARPQSLRGKTINKAPDTVYKWTPVLPQPWAGNGGDTPHLISVLRFWSIQRCVRNRARHNPRDSGTRQQKNGAKKVLAWKQLQNQIL